MNTNKQRIHSLDLIRGIALLGILIMNIISFSNIGMGYVNPTLGAGIDGYNGVLHGFSYLFAEMRFMSIFSMLFGAGLILFTDNLQQKELPIARVHYRRMVLLLCFGFLHAYLIWMGDILVMYSLCGMLVYWVRKWKIPSLLILSSLLFCVPLTFSTLTYQFVPMNELQEIYSFWIPGQNEIQSEIHAYRGSYLEQMEPRIDGAIQAQTVLFLMEQMWRILSMMLLGMVLYKSGILSGYKDRLFYLRYSIVYLVFGISFSAFALYQSYQHSWNGIWVMNVGHPMNYIASLFVALGYIHLIIFWSTTTCWAEVQHRLQAVGRMAFTNYILSSVICTFIFYGHGFGLFAHLDRLQNWGIIIVVWSLILIVSPIILRHYKQGPLEYIWRKGTYLNHKKS